MADSLAAPVPLERPLLARILRFFELLGAAILAGGLVAVAAIGQVAFQSPDILTHDQAGRFMTRIFEGSLLVETGAVGLIALGALTSGRIKRCALVAVLGGALIAGHFALAAGMRDIRLRNGGSVSALAKEHPDRQAFGRQHGIYVLLSVGLLALGLGILAIGPNEKMVRA